MMANGMIQKWRARDSIFGKMVTNTKDAIKMV
jgi:hypothetical protein